MRKYNATRWNTQLYTLQRLLEMRDAIKLTADVAGEGHPLHITQQEWLTIIDVINILKPCQVVTDKIQSNTATLLDVYTAFDKIMSESVSNSNGNDIANAIYNNIDWNSNNETSVHNIIKYRYLNYTNTAAIKTISILSMSRNRSLLQSIDPEKIKQEIIKI